MFFYHLNSKTALMLYLQTPECQRGGEKIKDYLVQSRHFTDGEIETCTTEWDRRTIQNVIVNWLVAEFGRELLRPSPGWFPLNQSISLFL